LELNGKVIKEGLEWKGYEIGIGRRNHNGAVRNKRKNYVNKEY